VETVPTRSEEQTGLDHALVRSLAWTGGARWATQVLTWGVTIILARLLTPDDFGIWAYAAVYHGVIMLLSEFGLGASVILIRDLDDDQVAQINGTAVLVSGLAVLLTFAMAYPMGWYYRSANLPAVIFALSGLFMVTSLRIVPNALLQKELRFKWLAFVEAGRTLAHSAALLGFALIGFGYWTLVLGAFVAELVHTTAILTLRRHGLAWPRLKSIRAAVTLSTDVVIGRFAWYLSGNSDVIVGGRVLGEARIGAYTMAYNLASLPIQKITTLVTAVTPAFFSIMQDSTADLRRYVLRLTEGLSLITFPVAIGLSLVARDFVSVVLGPEWYSAVAPLQILAAYAAVRSISPILTPVLNAIGESRFAMWNTVLGLVVLPVAFYWGVRRGTGGLAAGWVIAHPLVLFWLYRRTFRRIEMNVGAYLRALWPAFSGVAVMVSVILSVRYLFPVTAPIGSLAIDIGAGAAAYSVMLLTVHRERIRSLRRLLAMARGAPA